MPARTSGEFLKVFPAFRRQFVMLHRLGWRRALQGIEHPVNHRCCVARVQQPRLFQRCQLWPDPIWFLLFSLGKVKWKLAVEHRAGFALLGKILVDSLREVRVTRLPCAAASGKQRRPAIEMKPMLRMMNPSGAD